MQALEPGLKDEAVVGDQLDICFGDAMGDPDRVPVDCGRAARGPICAPAKVGMARIGEGACGRGAKAARDGQRQDRDPHFGAQLVHRQPPRQGVG